MPVKRTLTFREPISGKLLDFLNDEGLVCAHSLTHLSFLVGALPNYEEEGVPLSPTIVFSNVLEDLLRTLPGGTFHRIGARPLETDAAARILKECGVLASPEWFIAIQRSPTELTYGVASYSRLPGALSLRDAIALVQSGVTVVLQKIAPNTVELVGAKGGDLTIAFSTARDLETDEVRGPLRKFVASVVHDVADQENKSGLATYLEGALERALADAHGTILVCLKDASASSIPDMQDAVELSPELDFLAAYSEYKVSNSAESLLRLQSLESLLRGLLQSDGILVFTRRGSVSAYRGFYRPSAPASAQNVAAVVGGARRRAFEGIGTLVGTALAAALFRSQDGQTKLKEAEA